MGWTHETGSLIYFYHKDIPITNCVVFKKTFIHFTVYASNDFLHLCLKFFTMKIYIYMYENVDIYFHIDKYMEMSK